MLKLPTHGRYRYSADRDSAELRMAGRKAARFLYRTERRAFRLHGRTRQRSIRPRAAPQTQRNFAWRDYGLRVGIWRVFEMLDELQIAGDDPAEQPRLRHYPEVIDRIKRRGDDNLCAWPDQLREPWQASGSMTRHASLARPPRRSTRHFGARPRGWMGPAAAEIRATPDLLVEAGYTHSLGWPVDDQPIWMRTRSGPLLIVPVPDGTERHRRQHPPRPYRARVRRHDRRPVRGDARGSRAAAARHVGCPASVHLRSAVPAACRCGRH